MPDIKLLIWGETAIQEDNILNVNNNSGELKVGIDIPLKTV